MVELRQRVSPHFVETFFYFVYGLFFCTPQKDDFVYLDLGANIGVHALTMASLGCHVWAVDPLETNLRLVRETVLIQL